MKHSTFKSRDKPMARVSRNPANIKLRKAKKKELTITKLKLRLWKLTREIAAKRYPHFCYTCGTPLVWGSSVMQLGHFIPRSVCSMEMHFDLENLRWQCRFCNQFKDGQWPTFEANLIRDHGEEHVKALKRRNSRIATSRLGFRRSFRI